MATDDLINEDIFFFSKPIPYGRRYPDYYYNTNTNL